MRNTDEQCSILLVLESGERIAGLPGEKITEVVKRAFILPGGRPRGNMPLVLVPQPDATLDILVAVPPLRAFLKKDAVRRVILPSGEDASAEEIQELL